MIGRIAIDLRRNLLLQEGGFVPPEIRLSCLSAKVQEAVRACFGNLMPSIRSDENGRCWYEHYDEESRETTSIARPLDPGEIWPNHEAERLIEGWGRLQEVAQNIADERLRGFLLDFALPDPTTQSHSYRMYKDVEGTQRLHVLWGVIPREARHQSLPTAMVCEIVRTGLTTGIQPVAPARTGSSRVPLADAAAAGSPAPAATVDTADSGIPASSVRTLEVPVGEASETKVPVAHVTMPVELGRPAEAPAWLRLTGLLLMAVALVLLGFALPGLIQDWFGSTQDLPPILPPSR